jgi:hypothetical protein
VFLVDCVYSEIGKPPGTDLSGMRSEAARLIRALSDYGGSEENQELVLAVKATIVVSVRAAADGRAHGGVYTKRQSVSSP